MRVIVVNHSAYPFHSYGGVEKRVYHLTEYLKRKGVDAQIVTSFTKKFRKRRAVYRSVPYTFIWPCMHSESSDALPNLSKLSLFSLNAARYLRNQEFDILHAHQTDPFFYLHFGSRCPVVFQPFEEIYVRKMFLVPIKGFIGLLRRGLIYSLKKYVDNYCMVHADAIASEGNFQTEILVNHFKISKEKIFVLPVAVDIESVDLTLERMNVTRQDLKLSENDFVLISVGRLEPNKGVSYLIDAFKLIKETVGEAKLILIGTGSQEEEVKKQIARKGLTRETLHFKNLPEDLLYKYYALSDVYVSPVLDTGSVQGVIEAMSCSLPIVSTGQRFWVQNGVNGYVVPRGNAKAIADAVTKIYESNRTVTFGRRSREVAENYSYDVIAQIAIKKYEEFV